jgi:hypothetical protein
MLGVSWQSELKIFPGRFNKLIMRLRDKCEEIFARMSKLGHLSLLSQRLTGLQKK